MKTKSFAIAAIAAVLSVSCSGDYTLQNPDPQEGGDTVTLNVSLAGPSTKAIIAPGNTDDMSFHNAQIFVYNKLGKLEAKSGPVTVSENISLDIVPGQKTVWAIVNAPELQLNIGATQTPGEQRSLLSDNTLSSLVMSGSKSETVSTSTNISIAVKHIASKVVLSSILRNFENPEYNEVPLTVKKIYMSNVAADCNYDCTGTAPTVWNCQKGVLANPVENAALLLQSGLNIALPQGGPAHDTAYTFYVYPNPTTQDSTDDTWCPRKTRLVLECDYNGRTCYYPLTIRTDSIERNKVYRISALTLKHPGSVSPDKSGPEVSSDVACTFSVTVSDWEDVTPYAEEF